MLKAGAAFAILPAATTYARRWVKGTVIWEMQWESVPVDGTGYTSIWQPTNKPGPSTLTMAQIFNRPAADFPDFVVGQRDREIIQRDAVTVAGCKIPIEIDPLLKPGEWYLKPNPA